MHIYDFELKKIYKKTKIILNLCWFYGNWFPRYKNDLELKKNFDTFWNLLTASMNHRYWIYLLN